MKNYHLQLSERIIYSVSYISPLEGFGNIEKELKGKYKGRIIFDLLLCNGNTSDRFISVYFNGSNFNINKIGIIKPSNVILKRSLRFYNKHLDYVSNSVLTKMQRFCIKKNKHLRKI